MKHLFVIGNGFDRAHGLCTSYEDFREFLCEEYNVDKEACEVMPDLPEVMTGPKGDLIFDIEEAAAFLVGLISAAEPEGARWSDLEASLGLITMKIWGWLSKSLCQTSKNFSRSG